MAEAEGLLPRVAVVLRRTAFFPGFQAPLQGLFQGSDEIRPAIKRALASGKPAIVQIRIDSNVNAFDMPDFEKFLKWYDGKY